MTLLSHYVAKWEYEVRRKQEASRAEETRLLRLSVVERKPNQADRGMQPWMTALRRLVASVAHAVG